MISPKSQRRPVRLFFYVLGAIILILVLWPLPRVRGPVRGGSGADWEHLQAIHNETLGVQKVFAVGLPSRLDKRDIITLGSSVSDFQVQWIDGITPDQIDPKTYPYNWNYDHKPTEYAARRAHVNAMQRIVHERLGSAMILEDDTDWDTSFKNQLQSFAHAVRSLQGAESSPTHSPYGDDWDILWLGHCGLECREDLPYFLTPNDPTVPPPHHFLPYWRDPPAFERPDHARLTCTAHDGVCSMFYAASYRGAQRILAALSADPTEQANQVDTGAQFDVALGRMCGNGYLRCFMPYPSLTGGYRPPGPSSKSSDIHNPEGKMEGDVEGAFSYGVMYSTMLNINRILRGEETVHATWNDAAVPDVVPEELLPLGGIVGIPKEKP